MSYILPLMILGLIIYALIKRVDVYSAFTEGAAEALPMLIKILDGKVQGFLLLY